MAGWAQGDSASRLRLQREHRPEGPAAAACRVLVSAAQCCAPRDYVWNTGRHVLTMLARVRTECPPNSQMQRRREVGVVCHVALSLVDTQQAWQRVQPRLPSPTSVPGGFPV